MPSWWTRKSSKGSQSLDHRQQHEQCNHVIKKSKSNSSSGSRATSIMGNSRKNDEYRERSKSGSILFTHNSLRKSHDLKVSSVSFGGTSPFLGFDSEISEVVQKKAYPLPTPSILSEPSLDFDKEIALFGSETGLHSSSGSSASCFSSVCADGDCGDENVDFTSSRAVEETKCNSLKDSIHKSSWPLLQCDGDLESPSEKQENGRHPCHPLPLPPNSPIKSSHNPQPKWKKGKLLGRGTFGHVYVGFNSESGQMCAMKEVTVISDDQSSIECLKQLNQEITLLSELSHPNIVQYYGSKLEADKLTVHLEYVSGGSIHKLLSEYGPFTEPVIRSYTKQILSGLAYLHGRNTMHRDIKGANILVDPNGDIKLVDFGMAKQMASHCSILSFKGSPYWMAPEVILNSSSYNLAVDIWSLGCTVLEMATSKPPWSQYEGVAAMFKIANSKDYPEIPKYLSEDAQSFVKLCLQRDPSARPTAAELLHHPFIQNEDTKELASSNVGDDACSTTCGPHPVTTSHFLSHKSSFSPKERDHGIKRITEFSRT